MATMAKSSAPNMVCIFFKRGISSRQDLHQEAKKDIRTTLPLRDSLVVIESSVCREGRLNAGICLPSLLISTIPTREVDSRSFESVQPEVTSSTKNITAS